MTETLQIDFSRAIPVFPLPGCVLLPHGALPLHIFEARYREMVEDVIDSHGLIAMGLFEGPVTQNAYEHGRPPIRNYVCVGHVEHYRRLDDGRYLLLLRGLCRAKVIREYHHAPYRQFLLEPIDIEPIDDKTLEEQRRDLEQLLGDPLLRQVEAVEEVEPLLDEPIPTSALIDIVAMQVCDDPERRYPLLAETSALRRGLALAAHLRALREELKATG